MGYIVDAPGYGYSPFGLKVKKKYYGFLYDYLKISTRVCKVCILINAEHGVKDTDIQIFEKLKSLNLRIQVHISFRLYWLKPIKLKLNDFLRGPSLSPRSFRNTISWWIRYLFWPPRSWMRESKNYDMLFIRLCLKINRETWRGEKNCCLLSSWAIICQCSIKYFLKIRFKLNREKLINWSVRSGTSLRNKLHFDFLNFFNVIFI